LLCVDVETADGMHRFSGLRCTGKTRGPTPSNVAKAQSGLNISIGALGEHSPRFRDRLKNPLRAAEGISNLDDDRRERVFVIAQIDPEFHGCADAD
jgi:hypothetical protein